MSDPLRSLQELNDEAPDSDYPTTVCTLEEVYGVSADRRCWQETSIPVREIENPGDPVDPENPDDPWHPETYAKIERFREVLREGRPLPAVTVLHYPEDPVHQYFLMEGMHRYHAALREGAEMIHAWVAHIACPNCPAPDL